MRRRYEAGPEAGDINIFTQTTEECTKYGLCAYYDLCDLGISQMLLSEFHTDEWNPLIPEVPKKVALLDPQTEAVSIETFRGDV